MHRGARQKPVFPGRRDGGWVGPRTIGADPVDRIDADMLLRTLLAWLRGEPRVCSMVPVPDEATEDARRPMREREELIRARVALVNRIEAVLTGLGAGEEKPPGGGRPGRPRAPRPP